MEHAHVLCADGGLGGAYTLLASAVDTAASLRSERLGRHIRHRPATATAGSPACWTSTWPRPTGTTPDTDCDLRPPRPTTTHPDPHRPGHQSRTVPPRPPNPDRHLLPSRRGGSVLRSSSTRPRRHPRSRDPSRRLPRPDSHPRPGPPTTNSSPKPPTYTASTTRNPPHRPTWPPANTWHCSAPTWTVTTTSMYARPRTCH